MIRFLCWLGIHLRVTQHRDSRVLHCCSRHQFYADGTYIDGY